MDEPLFTPQTTRLTDDQTFDLSRRENFLLLGDCLNVLEKMSDRCIDLIYVDPPFCTQSRRQRMKTDHHYPDYWPGGLREFMTFLTDRLEQFHRVLKPTGSLYIHLDYRTVHYVKIELDRIFGEENFLNEIIWSYRTGGLSKKWFARKHQTILSYAKQNGTHKFHPIREGKFRTDGLNYDEEGRPYKSTRKGRLYFNPAGPTLTDVWEIPFLSTVGLERTGYPDQKPLALLDRIIRSSTDEGDRVADFFAGSGTTALAAQNKNRLFLSVDINPSAVDIAMKRLQSE
jgi:site-specific DNA-methyltransferase (adenine-specific)